MTESASSALNDAAERGGQLLGDLDSAFVDLTLDGEEEDDVEN